MRWRSGRNIMQYKMLFISIQRYKYPEPFQIYIYSYTYICIYVCIYLLPWKCTTFPLNIICLKLIHPPQIITMKVIYDFQCVRRIASQY